MASERFSDVIFWTQISGPLLQVCGALERVRFTDQEEFMDSDYLAEPIADTIPILSGYICTYAVSMLHSV